MTQQEFFSRYSYNIRTDKIGGGGFGTVYKAYDRTLHREVAIKVSEVKTAANGKVFSLKDEFDALKDLPKHPNIANYEELYSFEMPNGLFDYAVMQYYPDGNLTNLIGKSLSLEQKENIALQLLEGIDFLHKHKIVHRDLKPGNILIVRHGEETCPIITDFGLSKTANTSDRSMFSNSFGGGTARYSSPEQLQGQPLRMNTDLWSYGAVVYELFAGQPLFEAGTSAKNTAQADHEIYNKIINGDVSGRLGRMPEKWRKVLEQCLVVDPEKRAKSAKELQDKLSLQSLTPHEQLNMDDVTDVFEDTSEKERSRKEIPIRQTPQKPKTGDVENSGRRKWLPWIIGYRGVVVIVVAVMMLIAFFDSYESYMVTFILSEYFIFSSISLMFIMRIRKMLPWIMGTIASLAMGTVGFFTFWGSVLDFSLLILSLVFGLLSLIMAFKAKKIFPVKVIDEGLTGWRKKTLWYTGLTSFILVLVDSLLYYYYFTFVVIVITGLLSLIFGVISFTLALKAKKLLWWVIGGVVVSVIGLVLFLNRPTAVGVQSEEYMVNGVSFKMIHVEGGTFQMGATPEQGSDADDNEKPVHCVTVSDFCMGETEVTQALWKAVMGSEPRDHEGRRWTNEFGRGDLYPAYQVSWKDCQEFIGKLNQLTGKTFRLPTEAEWEYAARGGNKSKGYKYAGSNSLRIVGWYNNNSKMPHGWGAQGLRNVKMKMSNELGLYDMSGNVAEWCEDFFGNYYSSSQINPTGPLMGSGHVLRGGSAFYQWENECRVSSRNDAMWYNQGLRLVLVQ